MTEEINKKARKLVEKYIPLTRNWDGGSEMQVIDLPKEYYPIDTPIVESEGKVYEIDFGNHLRCKLKIIDNKIEVLDAMNGWGDAIPSDEIIINKSNY